MKRTALAGAAIVAVCVAPLPALAQAPSITAVEPTFASTPGPVEITGTALGPMGWTGGHGVQVTIGGAPAAVLEVTPTKLTVLPAESDPGFADVVVDHNGAVGTALGAAQKWPTLTASTDGLGGQVELSVALGDVGAFELWLAAAPLPAPLSLGPDIAYGLLLDPSGPLAPLASSPVLDGGPVALTFAAPTQSALLGVSVALQGFTQRGAVDPVSYSFTNLATVTFAGAAFDPPKNLAYVPSSATYTLGAPIVPNVPSVDGFVESYDVVALPQFGFYPLPAGLALDGASGVVSGTPLALQPPGNHLIVASNAAGSTSATLQLAVTGTPPNLLGYSHNPAVYAFGEEIVPNQPLVEGFVQSWSIDPPLPTGLAFIDGVVSGTPLAGSAAVDYTVTASNAAGSDSVDLSLAVTGALELLSVSVPQGGVWEVNRPIDLVFSAPIDPASVGPNTIAIQTESALPALGSFAIDPAAPHVVRFQPLCPIDGDLGGYGLLPGGVGYTLTAFGLASGPTTVQSTAGEPLGPTTVVGFTTPPGADPPSIFFDPVLGGPQPLLGGPGGGASPVSALLIQGAELPLELDSGGAPIPIPDVPLNLFSDPASAVTVLLRFDQPVGTGPANVSAARLTLERSVGSSSWEPIPTDVRLLANCAEGGALVALEPLGVLPPSTALRVRVGADFEDLIGETNLLAQSGFAHLVTVDPSDPTFSPAGDLADELFESFAVGGGAPLSVEGPPDPLLPAAVWANGQLQAAASFAGTGGPGGNFDWSIPAGTTEVLSTTTDSIVGGPDFLPTAIQNVVGGIVQVDDLHIEAGAQLRVTGPNPLIIYATGTVVIEGTIDASGIDSPPVVQLNSAQIPQPGANGVAGGGRGGVGSPLTTTSSPQGGGGLGAFDAPGLGGQGGEAGYALVSSDEARRGAGGGGGRFAADSTGPPDDALNAKAAQPGAPTAQGALSGSSPPTPGPAGPAAFVDVDEHGAPDGSNDFWGVLWEPGDPLDPTDDTIVVGELAAPSAGSGGGGGGDTVQAGVFPPVPFNPASDIKGGGGGGGGGQVQLLALGDIVLGAGARLVANGGDGGEGESTAGTNQIGGAGGGGSGGHVIVQTTGRLDLSANPAAVFEAIGGKGGVGQGDSHSGQGAGGWGGAGVIQVHLPSFAEFDPKTGAGHVILPSPGGDVAAAIDAVSAPNAWRLWPTYSRFSRARSIPIALGAGVDNPLSALTQPLFDFGGLELDAGQADFAAIETVLETVVAQPPILSGPVVALDALARVAALDAAALLTDASLPFSKDAYLRNPALLRECEVVLLNGPDDGSFTVANAIFGDAGTLLTLVLDASGGSLSAYENPGTTFELRPRFFRASTDGALDNLLDSQSIQIRFQALAATAEGLPDTASPLVAWTPDVHALNAPALPAPIAFVQFEVTFDRGAGSTATDPLPALEFLRLPFRF